MSSELRGTPTDGSSSDSGLLAPGCLSRFRLERFRLGELSGSEQAQIEAHLASCSACQERLGSVGAAKAEFDQRFDARELAGDLQQRLARAGATDAHAPLGSFLDEQTSAFDSMRDGRVAELLAQARRDAAPSAGPAGTVPALAASPVPPPDDVALAFMDEKTTAFDPMRDGNLRAVLSRANPETLGPEAEDEGREATAEVAPRRPMWSASKDERSVAQSRRPWVERALERLRELFAQPVMVGGAIMAMAVLAIFVPRLPLGPSLADPVYVGTRSGELAEPGDLEVYVLRNNEVQPARSGAEFRPGDRLQFILHPGGYQSVHLVNLDARGKLSWYYPGTGVNGLHLAGDAQVMLPGSIELDNYIGKELLLAVFSEEPIPFSTLEQAAQLLRAEHGDVLPLDAIDALPVEGTVQVRFRVTKRLRQ